MGFANLLMVILYFLCFESIIIDNEVTHQFCKFKLYYYFFKKRKKKWRNDLLDRYRPPPNLSSSAAASNTVSMVPTAMFTNIFYFGPVYAAAMLTNIFCFGPVYAQPL